MPELSERFSSHYGGLYPDPTFVKGAQDRMIAYQVTGHPDGYPVVSMHGMPGCRVGPSPRTGRLYARGVRLISYDRNGYGESEALEGRIVVDDVANVEAVADDLGLDEFALLGRSGGVSYALAAAAKLKGRVIDTTVLAGMGPLNLMTQWDSGVAKSNVEAYGAGKEAAVADITERYKRLKEDPQSLLDTLIRKGEVSPSDMRVLANVAMRAQIEAAYMEAVKYGPQGWIDDVLAARADWGFDLEEVTGPVRIWQGENDRFTTVNHARQIASQLVNAEVELIIEPGMSHFNAMERAVDYMLR